MRIGYGMDALAQANEQLLEPHRARVAQEFDNLGTFAAHLVMVAAIVKVQNRRALADIGKIITKDARTQIGEYQPGVGNYPAWEELAESTEDEKARLGAPPDAPLERFGDLKKSFRFTVIGDTEVVAGSTDFVMTYHEFGTSKMPPRPVLGPSLLKNIEAIQNLLGHRLMESFVVGQHLGYRFSVTGGIGDLKD